MLPAYPHEMPLAPDCAVQTERRNLEATRVLTGEKATLPGHVNTLGMHRGKPPSAGAGIVL